jgi:phosphopantothenoylcysteine decarboxylase/phosphopantothenate--cysteine ligase
MGFAIADAARKAGHRVTLVAGPAALPTPPGVERVDVVSAREMLAATLKAFRRADALFMAAAVSDWRPSRQLSGKWRAKDRPGSAIGLTLTRNPDILAACGRDRTRPGKVIVGFALETAASGVARARRKMRRKNADFIVLNDERALNASRASVLILGGGGAFRLLENRTKAQIARELVGLLGRR